MSLTSMIDHRRGPIRSWFEAEFPNLKLLQRDWKAAGRPTLLCPDGINPGTIGTAFDYRARFYFGLTSPNDFVARHGDLEEGRDIPWDVTDMAVARAEGADAWSVLVRELERVTANARPVRRRLSGDEEVELARCCWLLALFEGLARNRHRKVRSPLHDLPVAPSRAELLALVPSGAIDDLVGLGNAIHCTQFTSMGGSQVVLNPMFALSAVIPADGDLIVDGVLFEIKATKSLRMERAWAYQLLGYALGDWEDAMGIEAVGFYLARVPALIVRPLEPLLGEMSGRSRTLGQWRAEFRALCIDTEAGMR